MLICEEDSSWKRDMKIPSKNDHKSIVVDVKTYNEVKNYIFHVFILNYKFMECRESGRRQI